MRTQDFFTISNCTCVTQYFYKHESYILFSKKKYDEKEIFIIYLMWRLNDWYMF